MITFMKNIQKEIITFEEPLHYFADYPELKVHIERYFEYSNKISVKEKP